VNRKCTKCISNCSGDEKHYILYCTAPELVKIRKSFRQQSIIKYNFHLLSDDKVVQLILSNFEYEKYKNNHVAKTKTKVLQKEIKKSVSCQLHFTPPKNFEHDNV